MTHTALAIEAARWVESSRSDDTSLYAGVAGPVLLFLELYRRTAERHWEEAARCAADQLLASIDHQENTSLYFGISGTGFTLGRAFLMTRDDRYRDGAAAAVDRLVPVPSADIIEGNAGIGLFLLWAAKQLRVEDALSRATAFGDQLLASVQPTRRWLSRPGDTSEWPNFSHGTAGVAYFLAALYEATSDARFLEAAVAGARSLISLADGFLIPHNTVTGPGLYYLGWCHGPPGTARLFYKLHQLTREQEWLDFVSGSAEAMITRGAPQRIVSPGEWDNVGQCCGRAAQAEFFFSLYRITGVDRYRELALDATTEILARATRDDTGLRWVHAVNRVHPEETAAEPGYMQGASGVAALLLRLSAEDRDREGGLVLPDNPFPY